MTEPTGSGRAGRPGPRGRSGGLRGAGARHVRRHVHARQPPDRQRGGCERRGAGVVPAGLPGAQALPWRRAVLDVAVPHHRELRRHPPGQAVAAAAPRPCPTTTPSSTSTPSATPRPGADAVAPARPPRGRPRGPAAEAAGRRRAPRRLRPAPRGDRRRARASPSRRPRCACTGPAASSASACSRVAPTPST